MKKTFKDMILYLIIIIILFYLLPFSMKDTGSAMSLLLIFIPAGCFITSLIYGIRHSFNILFVASVFILFLPTILIFYNQSATFYSYIYGAITAIGNGIGAVIYNRLNKSNK